jgi:hypothetical protein
MNRTVDPLAQQPGDLLHAMLEDWIVAEISDVTSPRTQQELKPARDLRRRPGIKSVRTSTVSASPRLRKYE